ncbi:MAG: aldo/keto reductase [Bifidobacteriaceae bacterium]|jgi:L-glyceraldehyde 3-phosphate reductase|nr:aldo/keto reductase [Bifidobacteriaceae bacterium]MCI1979468.1 aldo/keto reductase [Bifidobacteriaceae bacterium]
MDLIPPYVANADRYDGRMKYSRTGRSGLFMPQVSLGFWHNFGNINNYDTMRAVCRTAFDAGITQFDAANNYGPEYGAAETNLGRLLATDFKPYRDELIVTSKAGYDMWPGPYGDHGSRKYLIASCDQSLKRLGLDYVDIFYHHRPDPDTPLEETMLALDHIVRSGRALYVGISNYNAQQTREAAAILHELKTPFVINQVRYNIFDRHIEADGLKEAAKEAGIGLIAFSPLEQGLLTDRYLNGIPEDSRIAHDPRFLNESALTPERLQQIRDLNEIAKRRGQTLAEMSLAWILRDGADGAVASVLVGASRPSQLLDNVAAIANTDFSAEELAAIDKISPVK